MGVLGKTLNYSRSGGRPTKHKVSTDFQFALERCNRTVEHYNRTVNRTGPIELVKSKTTLRLWESDYLLFLPSPMYDHVYASKPLAPITILEHCDDNKLCTSRK